MMIYQSSDPYSGDQGPAEAVAKPWWGSGAEPQDPKPCVALWRQARLSDLIRRIDGLYLYSVQSNIATPNYKSS